MKHFKVLGTGCGKCVTTAESIERVAQELGVTSRLISRASVALTLSVAFPHNRKAYGTS